MNTTKVNVRIHQWTESTPTYIAAVIDLFNGKTLFIRFNGSMEIEDTMDWSKYGWRPIL